MFFHSQLLCAKHTDPTDGNIVPFVPRNRLVGTAPTRYGRFDKPPEINKKLPSMISVGDDNVTNCCHGDLLFEITSKIVCALWRASEGENENKRDVSSGGHEK